MLKDGFFVASVMAMISFGFVGVGLGGLFSNTDSRLVLTVTETFGGLAGVRDLIKNTSSYIAGANPSGILHARYPILPQTLEEYQDNERRGLIPASMLKGLLFNSTPSPSLLDRLMMMAWCSSGYPIPGGFPALRTAGCRCIADVYLALVTETRPANATNLTKVDVPQEVRDRLGGRVYKCWDQRQVSRSRSCGRVCTTHVVGVGVFPNMIMFLVCAAFLLAVYMNEGRMLVKLAILFLGVAFSSIFFIKDMEANTLNIAGIMASAFLLVWSLDEELNMGSPVKLLDDFNQIPNIPHPLIVCVLVNLPLMLSAHTYQLGVSGHGRDLWAVASFCFCGGILGVILQVLPPPLCAYLFFCALTPFFFTQRYFWMSWYGSQDSGGYLGRSALVVAYIGTLMLLFLLFFAYRYEGSAYMSGGWLAFIAYFVFLSVLPWILNEDLFNRTSTPAPRELTEMQMLFMGLVVVANALVAVVAVADVGNHPRKALF